MSQYNLELNILSCLLQRPELMNDFILSDKHFVKFYRLWMFMKTYYNKYHNFDLVMMASLCKDKYHIIEYLTMIVETEPAPSRFKEYQQQLIKLHEESEKEKRLIEELFELANKLYVRDLSLEKYKEAVNKLLGGE